MLHHVEIYVSDIDVSHAFWSTVLTEIGWTETGRWSDGFTFSRGEDAYLTFVRVADRHASLAYHRCGVGLNHLAFRVATRDGVDTIRTRCLANGFVELYGDRYPFANGGTDYYALFVEDPDRIKVEFVAST